jgi:hypothetical protein
MTATSGSTGRHPNGYDGTLNLVGPGRDGHGITVRRFAQCTVREAGGTTVDYFELRVKDGKVEQTDPPGPWRWASRNMVADHEGGFRSLTGESTSHTGGPFRQTRGRQA